jgi:antirestriction protein ArdC
MTYRQAKTNGYQARRGEKGTQVQYWRFDEERKIIEQYASTAGAKLAASNIPSSATPLS